MQKKQQVNGQSFPRRVFESFKKDKAFKRIDNRYKMSTLVLEPYINLDGREEDIRKDDYILFLSKILASSGESVIYNKMLGVLDKLYLDSKDRTEYSNDEILESLMKIQIKVVIKDISGKNILEFPFNPFGSRFIATYNDVMKNSDTPKRLLFCNLYKASGAELHNAYKIFKANAINARLGNEVFKMLKEMKIR